MFHSEEITIEKIVEEKIRFFIPVYQRPYVWDDVQINKLLEDLTEHCNLDKEYYVGNIYVTKKDDTNTSFDVIDGQQRFTTFWLISLYFLNQEDALLRNFIQTENHEIRLNFDIRVEVSNYLNDLISDTKSFNRKDADEDEFLKYISRGIQTIKAFFEKKDNSEVSLKLQEYIYKKVHFVFNIAPKNTDLNSLFTTLGNSGIQLEQSDILKARLLNILKSQRFEYSKIWEACENLNRYFEKNVSDIFFKNKSSFNLDLLQKYNADVFSPLKSEESVELNFEGKTITEILDDEFNEKVDFEENKVNVRCRSIISFNALLIHTYRIFRFRKGEMDLETFDIKRLLELFKDLTDKKNEVEVKEFFELLWEVRYMFDQYIVKWRSPNSDDSESYEEHLLLTSLGDPQGYFTRTNQKFSDDQMLQSVLYYNSGFGQQYWLTPYLNFLLSNSNCSPEQKLQILERIDNYMLPGRKKDSSWELCNNLNLRPNFDIDHYLSQNLGTAFEHYWFYKLEYLLWKNWENRGHQEFVKYRISSKNSVEHVLSRNDEHGKVLTADDSLLHSFGNLGLLSVGQNSSYSNQDIGKKKIDFKEKKTLDSLKLYHIYNSFSDSKEWYEKKIEEHRNNMINLLSEHYNKDHHYTNYLEYVSK